MLTKLLKLVKEKYSIDKKQDWYKGSITYFDWLKDEIEEVREELKENNSVYLEDELWDILRDYLNLIESLKWEWKISSLENIVLRAEKKYFERVKAIKWKKDKVSPWFETKSKQKEGLKKEHNLRYKK